MRVEAAKVLWYLTKSKQNVAKCTSLQFSTWPTPLFRARIFMYRRMKALD